MLRNAQALVQHANCGEPGGGSTGQLRAKGEAADAINSIELFISSTLAAFYTKTCSATKGDQGGERIDFRYEVRRDGEILCRGCGGEKLREAILLKSKWRGTRGSAASESSRPICCVS